MKKYFFLIVLGGMLITALILSYTPVSAPVEVREEESQTEQQKQPAASEDRASDAPLNDGPEIIVDEPLSDEVIKSPLHVRGQVRGTWLFEASMPVSILDGKKNMIAKAPATTAENWMTTDFVSFEANLSFKTPLTDTGFLLIEADNPSGLEENARAYMIPIRFR